MPLFVSKDICKTVSYEYESFHGQLKIPKTYFRDKNFHRNNHKEYLKNLVPAPTEMIVKSINSL